MPDLLVLDSLPALQATLAPERSAGHSVGLVPTMGNLHAGHLALVAAARAQCDFVLATIFVNPLQFGANEDLTRYPRSFTADCAALAAAGCNAVFTPDTATMYPDGMDAHTRITVPGLSTLHCGQSRPGHFDGVCTVVCKLFNMTQAQHAFFGLKDYQQFHLINRMVADLQLPITLHGVPTVREPSGLALSSRNGYLDDKQRQQAAALHTTLQHCAARISAGTRHYAALQQQARERLAQAGLRPDYVHICQRDTLLPATDADSKLVILAAAFVGGTRLIDNLTVTAASTD